EIWQRLEVEAVSEQTRIYLRRDQLVLRGDVQRQNEGGRFGLEDDVHDAAATRLLGAGTGPGKGKRRRRAADQAGRGERCRRGRGPGYEVTTIEQVLNHGAPRLALKEFAKEGSVGSTVPAAVPNT